MRTGRERLPGARIQHTVLLGALLIVAAPLGCDQPPEALQAERLPAPTAMLYRVLPTGAPGAKAHADFRVVPGSSLEGSAHFEEVASGVKVTVDVAHAPPGEKGVHIHEKGDCSDIAGQSMGTHFSPQPSPHGLPDSAVHHIGDFGNIQIDEQGNGELEIVAKGARLQSGDSFLGRAIVVHEGQDKGTQPTGDAGNPIACGVIVAG
jgi:superoxide dismutase, Cu-Zn family